ncbi:MAG: hypothetical protein J6Y48_01375, partial [Clostridia bacterium]|nr:hypothetical protein [Clostridia bacterium]
MKKLNERENGGISLKDIFLLVDGNSLMHRAFHALPVMDADGVYTNAIYGFLSMLLKVIKEEN